jgi:hypothetical protein
MAADRPAGPPPTITTSYSIDSRCTIFFLVMGYAGQRQWLARESVDSALPVKIHGRPAARCAFW